MQRNPLVFASSLKTQKGFVVGAVSDTPSRSQVPTLPVRKQLGIIAYVAVPVNCALETSPFTVVNGECETRCILLFESPLQSIRRCTWACGPFDLNFRFKVNICMVEPLSPRYVSKNWVLGLETIFTISAQLISRHLADFEGSP